MDYGWLVIGTFAFFVFELFGIRSDNKIKIPLRDIFVQRFFPILTVLIYRFFVSVLIWKFVEYKKLYPDFLSDVTIIRAILVGMFPGISTLLANGLTPKVPGVLSTFVKDLIYFLMYKTKRLILDHIHQVERDADEEILETYKHKEYHIQLFYEKYKTKIVRRMLVENQYRLTYEKVQKFLGNLRIKNAISTKNYNLMRFHGLAKYRELLDLFEPEKFVVKERWKELLNLEPKLNFEERGGDRRSSEQLPQ